MTMNRCQSGSPIFCDCGVCSIFTIFGAILIGFPRHFVPEILVRLGLLPFGHDISAFVKKISHLRRFGSYRLRHNCRYQCRQTHFQPSATAISSFIPLLTV